MILSVGTMRQQIWKPFLYMIFPFDCALWSTRCLAGKMAFLLRAFFSFSTHWRKHAARSFSKREKTLTKIQSMGRKFGLKREGYRSWTARVGKREGGIFIDIIMISWKNYLHGDYRKIRCVSHRVHSMESQILIVWKLSYWFSFSLSPFFTTLAFHFISAEVVRISV